jgi:hypothetical protein
MGNDWPALEIVLGEFGSVEAAVRAAGIQSRAPRAQAVGE